MAHSGLSLCLVLEGEKAPRVPQLPRSRAHCLGTNDCCLRTLVALQSAGDAGLRPTPASSPGRPLLHAPPLPHAPPTLTSTCHTCSLALRKLQKRTLAPSRPWPPHMLLGTTSTSRTFMVFMLNTSSFTGFSTLAFSRAFSVSFSLFCGGSRADS